MAGFIGLSIKVSDRYCDEPYIFYCPPRFVFVMLMNIKDSGEQEYVADLLASRKLVLEYVSEITRPVCRPRVPFKKKRMSALLSDFLQ
jgi:hypothetical protein